MGSLGAEVGRFDAELRRGAAGAIGGKDEKLILRIDTK